ncbi:hypothetical protein QBC39DRAFT_386927 [Podospora conica]|nr:hypothetical protein QBC39DRAFT_386927 [Schizothecium conicum]
MSGDDDDTAAGKATRGSAGAEVRTSTVSAPTPAAPAAANNTTAPNPDAAAMASEPIEYDDFGLPIRKFKPPPTPPAVEPEPEAEQTTDEASRPESKEGGSSGGSPVPEEGSIPGHKTEQPTGATRKSQDTDSGSEEEFKDAVSMPESGAPSRASGEGKPGVQAASLKEEAADDKTAQGKGDAGTDESKEARSPARDALAHASPKPEEPEKTSAADKKSLEGNKEDGKVTAPQKATETGHDGKASEAAVPEATAGVSEFSHQPLPAPKSEKVEKEDDEWQTMPAYAPYDIYDDDNKLIAKEYNEEVVETETYGYGGLGGAGKGYTRVFVDDDAESATSMDDNTQYLFKDKLQTTAVTDEDDAQRDAVGQLEATKDLLTEGQRVAYVGLTRLELSAMVKELEDMPQTRRVKKELNFAAESMKMWSQKMMIRLYAHMDINPAEQIMIEQLTAHGVMPQDLTPVLMANARVKNPMAETPEKSPSGSGSAASSRPVSVASPSFERPATPPPAYDADAGTELSAPVKMPSQMETTQKIDIDLRWTVLCDLFLVLIADSVYDSRSRVLLERVGKDLEIPWIDICRFEKKVTDALEMQQQAEKENWNEDEHMEVRRKADLKRRYMVMGLATVGGGLVIGLSAGLLAPMIGLGLAAGFTTIGVGGTGTFLAGAGGAAIITSTAAASGSLIGGRAANRRTGSVKTFEYRPLHNNKRVNLIVTVAGWMTGKVDDVRLPFSTVDPVMGDLYSVLWEPEMLTSMGDTINILATEALTQGLQQVLGSTILVALMSALQLPVVLTKLSYLIDNPWTVSLGRAQMAGLILADSLIDRNLGTRPITLVGYSLGSRVIFTCLQELAKKGAYGLVQNVFLFGSPVVVNQDEYLRARAVVSGRFVSAYNRNDWILGYLFRLTGGGIRRVAGLAPVEGIPGLENVDVSELVAGHMDYRRAMPRLLRECGFLVDSDEFTEIEDPDPENHGQRQRELINEIEEARKILEEEQNPKKGVKGAFGFFRKKKALQKQEWEVYEDKSKAGAHSATTEDKDGNNHGVLFDVDAIRAELARSTANGDRPVDEEMLQVREIKSTLPPMKLDLSPTPSLPSLALARGSGGNRSVSAALPTTAARPASGEFRSSSTMPTPALGHARRPSQQRHTSYQHKSQPSLDRTPTFPATKAETDGYKPFAAGYHSPPPPPDDDIQMTFVESEPKPKPASPKPSSPSPRLSHSPNPSISPAPAPPQRPEPKTVQTAPPSVPVAANPWADFDDDEDDFGKEKEMTMTFA